MAEPPSPSAPLRPCRRDYLAAACFFTLIAIYGSLVPLRFVPLSIADAWNRFRDLPLLTLSIESRADWVANILLFIPIGFCGMATAIVDRPRLAIRSMLAAVAVLFLATLLSFAIEFTQIWFPPRTTSQNDIQAEIIGALVGIGFAWAFVQPITQWLRQFATGRHPHARLIWLLEAYLAGLVIYQMLPLDLTLNPRDMWKKHRAGRIEWPPFSRVPDDIESISSALTELILYIPVGALALVWLRTRINDRATLLGATLLGAALATLIEILQVLVYSRFASATDMVVASVGVLIGAAIAGRVIGTAHSLNKNPRALTSKRLLAGGALVAVYCVLLVYIFCWPLEPLADPARIERRLAGFFSVPFARMYWGSEFNAVTQVLAKLLCFAPLGVLAALLIRGGALSKTARRAWIVLSLALVACLATAIELAQIFYPPHVADVTDVFICMGGAALGHYLAHRVVQR
jgi:VanZ family protein